MYVSIQGQCHFFYFGPRSFTYENKSLFFSKPLGHFNQILYMEIKIYEHDAGHMTKMGATSIYGITHIAFKNILLRNLWTDLNETWYVALMTHHHSLFKL